jgi:UDP-2,4-diacetamido-2,4,6-trideoxy-beta-L-altropyranose hydrolase
MIIIKRKIFFRADGNSRIGLGHITRSLALAEILRDDFEVNFIAKYPTESVKNNILKICSNLIIVPEEFSYEEEYLFYSSYLTVGDIVVLDGYNFSTEYQKKIKMHGCVLVSIDDIHNYHFVSDVIINHNSAISISNYSKEAYTKLYIGFDYLLLRKIFIEQARQQRKIDDFDTVFVCIGGADPENLTYKIADTCNKLKVFKKINIVTGSAYLYFEELDRFVKQNKSISYFQDLQAKQMLEVMVSSQIAICPASSISLELCCVGLNLITGYFVENQKVLASYINDAQLGYSVGDFLQIDQDVLSEAILENKNKEFYKNQKNKFNGNQIENLKKIFTSI